MQKVVSGAASPALGVISPVSEVASPALPASKSAAITGSSQREPRSAPGAAAPVGGAAYFDHAASTPVDARVVEAMLPYFSECYANPTGAHRMARRARRAIDDARDALAEGLAAEPDEVVFCGSGTEANNLAVFGAAAAAGGGRVLCSAFEHHAVLRPVQSLAGGVVGCERSGALDLDALSEALNEDVALVSVMLVNNETGVITPLGEVAEILRRRAPQALLHTDAVQGFPWLDVAEATREADLISLSAHKFGGPKGVGALVVRGNARLRAQTLGGGQEMGLRSGTQNTSGIVGMGKAVEIVLSERPSATERVRVLRDRLADGILAAMEGVVETGVRSFGREASSPEAMAETPEVDRSGKAAGFCHLCFEGVESEALLFLLEREGVYASAASSCASGAEEPSHVLAAMGLPRALARGSLRLSLGYATTQDDVDRALSVLPAAVAQLRRAPA